MNYALDPFYAEVVAVALTAVAFFIGVVLIHWARRIGG